MKIFLLNPIAQSQPADVHNNTANSPFKKEQEQTAKEPALPPYELIVLPDTALTDRNKPFFIPDLAAPCQLLAYAVFRVGRLGRHISPRFAYRYIDAITIAATFRAPALAQALRNAHRAPDMAYAFDGSICRGIWQVLPMGGEDKRNWEDFELRLNGKPLFQGKAPKTADVDNALAFVSTICKIAEGDILLAPTPVTQIAESPVYVKPNDHIDGVQGKLPVLSFNVK